MKTTKFTPGPWEWIDRVHASIVKGDIAIIPGIVGGNSVAEAEANARLIAAAPELLSIVKKLAYNEGIGWREDEFRKDMWSLMMEVINKIEGK